MEAQKYLISIRSRGLTQAEVSEKTGISQPTISKIERGSVKDVRATTLLLLQQLHAALARKGSRTRRVVTQ